MRRDPDFIQHGMGPYIVMKMDGKTFPFLVGSTDLKTGRHFAPNSGYFNVDGPVLGTVLYDSDLRRIIQPVFPSTPGRDDSPSS